MANIFKQLASLPQLLMHAGLLQADVQEAQTDPDILAELDKCPNLKARLAQISAEWRAVENDVDKIKHG